MVGTPQWQTVCLLDCGKCLSASNAAPTNCTEQSPSWEADSRSVAQLITVFTTAAHIRSQMTPLFCKIRFNIIIPSTPLSPKLPLKCRFYNKEFMRVFHLPCVLHVLPISFFIWSPYSNLFGEDYILARLLCKCSILLLWPNPWNRVLLRQLIVA
jgi:hypothetical protein